MKTNDHVMILGTLHIAWSLLILSGVIVIIVLFLAGVMTADDSTATLITAIAAIASTMLIAFSGLGFVAAWGLFKRRSWSRYLLMVLGAVWAIKIPVGTALGIYTFYVLTRDEVVKQFDVRPDAT
jgi:uncharacterized membrane protein (DUF2068 family)